MDKNLSKRLTQYQSQLKTIQEDIAKDVIGHFVKTLIPKVIKGQIKCGPAFEETLKNYAKEDEVYTWSERFLSTGAKTLLDSAMDIVLEKIPMLCKDATSLDDFVKTYFKSNIFDDLSSSNTKAILENFYLELVEGDCLGTDLLTVEQYTDIDIDDTKVEGWAELYHNNEKAVYFINSFNYTALLNMIFFCYVNSRANGNT